MDSYSGLEDAAVVEKDPTGRYLRYDEVLGRGTFKTVCKAFDEVDGVEVAWCRVNIKGVEEVERLYSEVHLLKSLFVNGFNGELKIGDLGLAIVMQQPTAHSIIGTPEFMAPELYDEEYNELVDIYSFGMCLLEMVTCEYPYNECKNLAQIYEKVTSGVKPASLSKVDNPQIKQFMEKYLVPVSMRLSAVELLKDPILAIDNLTGSSCDLSQLNKLLNLPDPASNSSVLELQGFSKNNEFRLRAERNPVNTVSLTLLIADTCGLVRYIRFEFYLESDTVISIAGEMVEQLHLLHEDVSVVAELLDNSLEIVVLCY